MAIVSPKSIRDRLHTPKDSMTQAKGRLQGGMINILSSLNERLIFMTHEI